MYTITAVAAALAIFSNLSNAAALPSNKDIQARRPSPLAADIILGSEGIDPDTMFCFTKYTPYLYYNVQVGVPFNGGSGCGDIQNALTNSLAAVASSNANRDILVVDFQCNSAASDANTILSWNSFAGAGSSINAALNAMYPSVQGGFDCPDN